MLIDGYDQLGFLTSSINHLLRQEYTEHFSVLVGCVHFGQLILNQPESMNVERDAPPIVLDDDENRVAHLNLIAKRFIARSWAGLFDSETLARLDAAAILGPSGRPHEYFGFECFSELSGGKVRWLLKLCKNAFDSVEMVDGVPRIAPAKQSEAAAAVSKEIYDFEIRSQGKSESYEIQRLCRYIARRLKSDSKRGASVQSEIEVPTEVELAEAPRVAEVIRRAIRHRFLQCHRKERILIEMNEEYVPRSLRMAGILAPRFDVPWR